MIENDTVRLLRECDAGIKMGIGSINDVLKYIKDEKFRNQLDNSKNHHERLQNEIEQLLDSYHDDGKEPSAMAKGMSWFKTNVVLSMDESDNSVASFLTDGCNMGIKSLNKYLNQYKAADEKSKDIAKRLINLEEDLAIDIRQYL